MNLLFWNCLSYSDTINTLTAFSTFLILVVAFFQLNALRKINKITLTYKVDEDFENFLNHPDNKPARDWLLNDGEIKLKDYDILRQLFDKAEAIYSLKKRKVINDEVFYDLLSHYIECFFVGTQKPSAKQYITHVRNDTAKKGFTIPSDMYIGIERLYEKVVRMSKKRRKEPKI